MTKEKPRRFVILNEPSQRNYINYNLLLKTTGNDTIKLVFNNNKKRK